MASVQDITPRSPRERAFAIDVNQTPFNGLHGDLVFDEAAIRQCFGNIIIGYVGCKSRIFGDMTFGSQIYGALQAPLADITATKMRASLLQAVSKWEDRVRINANDIRITPDRSIPGYRITVHYRIRATEKDALAVFNLRLNTF